MMMRVGFIGLGIMGRPMALNLLRAGYQVTVWSRRQASMAPLLEAGALAAENPAAVAAASEVVFSMVADAPDVRAVMLGADGVAQGGRAGLIAVDMSTIPPAAAKSIASDLASHCIVFLDAPVSGGEVGAVAGTLSIMVGGDQKAFDKVQPLFGCMGKNVVYIGEPGSGQVAKAANQILTGVGVLAVAEAMTFAKKNGADPARVREALMGGFAGSKILENHGQRMIDRNFKPGFKSWMHGKDMNICRRRQQPPRCTKRWWAQASVKKIQSPCSNCWKAYLA
jgi:2-hydroxy-3-oxopropionate reductase